MCISQFVKPEPNFQIWLSNLLIFFFELLIGKAPPLKKSETNLTLINVDSSCLARRAHYYKIFVYRRLCQQKRYMTFLGIVLHLYSVQLYTYHYVKYNITMRCMQLKYIRSTEELSFECLTLFIR